VNPADGRWETPCYHRIAVMLGSLKPLSLDKGMESFAQWVAKLTRTGLVSTPHLILVTERLSTMKKPRTLAQRFMISLGKIIARSDVKLLRRKKWPGMLKRKAWEKLLPEDMLSFFEAQNGFSFSWTFHDEDEWHGPHLVGLYDTGKKTINPVVNRFALPLLKAKAFPGGPLRDKFDCEITPTHQALLFEGTDDSAGAVLLLDKAAQVLGIHQYHNDGYIVRFADTFTEAIEKGISVGFSHTWRDANHPVAESVRKRLAEPVPLRTTFEVTIQTLTLGDNSLWRSWLGANCSDWQFDRVMKALKQKNRYAKTTAEERGQLYNTHLANPKDLSDDQILKILKETHRLKNGTREDFNRIFHCHPGQLAQFSMKVVHHPRPDLPLVTIDEVKMRILMSIDAFQGLHDACPYESDVICYCPEGMIDQPWQPIAGFHSSSAQAHPDGKQEFILEGFLPAEYTAGMEIGRVYLSNALPSLESNVDNT
jgi:hypothetical protein